MAEQLDGRRILRQAKRVVHRCQDDAGPELDPRRRLRDRRPDDEERRHVPVIDEVVLGRPDGREAEPLRLDGQADRLVVGARPIGLAGPKLRAEQSEAKSHGADDTSQKEQACDLPRLTPAPSRVPRRTCNRLLIRPGRLQAMTTARPDSRLGTDLGPYRIERVLGRGGMGVVYLAEQQELGRKVALKLLPDELAHDADFRARFERESRLAAAIDHPNVIPLYEAGEVDGVLFLAMRYVDGTDLASRLHEGPLPNATAIELLAQVAGALDAAHAKGLVHRDVKPGNVLLDRTGSDERPHAYLTDFGLTKQAGSETGLTRAGAFLGTPAYMAPEQVDGTEVDGRADQYALGAMAFECLTGRVPFVRDKEVAVALAHLKDPVPSAVALQPALPTPVDVVLAKVMAKDREARYPSCAAFVEDLRAALGGGAVVARPVPTEQRNRPMVLFGAVAGLGLLVVAGLALASGLLGGAGASGASPSGSIAIGGSLSATGSPATTATSDFPDRAEAALLTKLPAESRSRCVRGTRASSREPRDSGRAGAGDDPLHAGQRDARGQTAGRARTRDR